MTKNTTRLPEDAQTLPEYLNALIPTLQGRWPGAGWFGETTEDGTPYTIITLPSPPALSAVAHVIVEPVETGGFAVSVSASGERGEGPCAVSMLRAVFGRARAGLGEAPKVVA